MSNLDISERRLPQDGRIKVRSARDGDGPARLGAARRLGEKIVMRIADSGGLSVQLSKLGFEPEALAVFNRA